MLARTRASAYAAGMLAPLFSGGSLDRAAALRPRAGELLADPAARVLPLWRGKPLFDMAGAPRLVWLRPGASPLEAAAEGPVFLGLSDGAPRFAADVSALAEQEGGDEPRFRDERTLALSETRRFVELRGLMAEIDPEEAGDAATAKGLLEWRRAHPRCSRCGEPTALEDGGWRTGCPACGAKHFPRTDPVVIMLATRGERVLLGRQAIWPAGMYSLLAGYMEPGETIEEAARREVLEESGVEIGRVAYLCSQPWPFPASLMIAVAAEALTEAIRRDDQELEDAIWASRAEVAAALRGEPGRFTPARKGSVARAALEAWTAGETPKW